MRIVLIGVSHWHTPFYFDPAMEMTDVRIVGVSDPDVPAPAPTPPKPAAPPSPTTAKCVLG